MRVLKLGSTGADVKRWEMFLTGQGFFTGLVDGIFDDATVQATREFQTKHGLGVDGKVGNQTLGQAMVLGFESVRDDDPATTGPNFPPPPAFSPLVSTADRQRLFGRFQFAHEPLPNNPENIRILGDWVQQNIVRVTIPQLRGVRGGSSGVMRFHRLAADQLVALWAAWEQAGLLDKVLSYQGAFVPRFQRGSRTVLSNHAFGSAFDINEPFNGFGAIPALVGQRGCVRELVQLANEHGFYWGGHFRRRPDGMHFEVAVLR